MFETAGYLKMVEPMFSGGLRYLTREMPYAKTTASYNFTQKGNDMDFNSLLNQVLGAVQQSGNKVMSDNNPLNSFGGGALIGGLGGGFVGKAPRHNPRCQLIGFQTFGFLPPGKLLSPDIPENESRQRPTHDNRSYERNTVNAVCPKPRQIVVGSVPCAKSSESTNCNTHNTRHRRYEFTALYKAQHGKNTCSCYRDN